MHKVCAVVSEHARNKGVNECEVRMAGERGRSK